MHDRSEYVVNSQGTKVDWLDGVWKRKLIVIVTTLIVSGAAFIYGQLATPLYVAKVFVQPPTQNDIAPLNYGRGGKTGLNALAVKEVYDVYLRNLQSESLRRRFFENVYLAGMKGGARSGSQDERYENFQKTLSIALASNDDPSRYAVAMDSSDPRLAAEWVVQYAEMAGRLAQHQVLQDVKADALVKARNLESGIVSDLEGARMEREDRIVQLKEALRVARSVGLRKPPVISSSLSKEVSGAMDGSLMYMRGTEALEAEIDNLTKRASDEPFIRNLRPRQKIVEFYRSLEINVDGLRVYRQDGVAELPDLPVKPKKVWLFVLGLVAGAALGVVIAMAHMVVGQRKLRARL
ncbi:Wzz/FepE/Etk N-terminal domain-containing protein [Pseudomonas sp. NY15374]|uniref:Wzz/FepE/Etk N-terminal domain-containing protein n=1 Tax=Pseudomonas sp. NY15374 TaxID=3400357 RepID=UPI003A8C669C